MTDIDVVFAEVRAVDPGVLDQAGLAVLVAQLGVVDGYRRNSQLGALQVQPHPDDLGITPTDSGPNAKQLPLFN